MNSLADREKIFVAVEHYFSSDRNPADFNELAQRIEEEIKRNMSKDRLATVRVVAACVIERAQHVLTPRDFKLMEQSIKDLVVTFQMIESAVMETYDDGVKAAQIKLLDELADIWPPALEWKIEELRTKIMKGGST